jgi:3-deoxy-D-manno-octulosonic-acid transferase
MNAFDLAYLASLPIVAPGMAYKRLRHGKYRESLPAMLGRRLPNPPLPPAPTHRCRLHAVSVGETIAAGAVWRELRRRVPEWEYLVTTTTETGQAQAHTTLGGAQHFTYAPADFSWTVRRFHQAWRPTIYLFFETEIWPNMLLDCGARGIPTYLVNGKLSERSARGYARGASILRRPLAAVRRFYMQTPGDAERLERVLGNPARIEVAGNVKFDALPEPLSADERADLRRRWGIPPQTLVVLAGSTHPGEEELIWNAFRQARRDVPAMVLVLAPRHPERFAAVADDLRRWGARVHATSTGDNPAPPGQTDVVLIDQMRVLARSYGAADLALVAGSWAPIGGHNLLEAAVHGIPVLRGPHMHAQPDIVRVLGPDDGAPEVAADRLGDEIVRLATHADARIRLGQAAARAAHSNRGAAARVVEGILADLAQAVPKS